ncbi:MAG: DUF4238 domain-containing protein [Candidatus Odinarchaeota archaeon]
MPRPTLNHYVPRFYQKAFITTGQTIFEFDLDNPSSGGTPRNVGKSAATQKLYPDSLETALSKVENDQAPVIKRINQEKKIPTGKSRDKLLQFIALQHKRIEGNKENHRRKIEVVTNSVFNGMTASPLIEAKMQSFKKQYPEKLFVYLINNTKEIHWRGLNDLEIARIENDTAKDFFFSDHPAVIKNIKLNDPSHDSKGLTQQGCMIFLPTSPGIMVILYDRQHYWLKSKKNHYTVTERSDIDNLNLLQLYNCHQYIHYGRQTDLNYIRSLHSPHQTKIEQTRKKLIILGDTVVRPDSTFIPELTFLEDRGKEITGNYRNKRIHGKLVSASNKAREIWIKSLKFD